jgi:surface protein
MASMFAGVASFDQPLGNWNVFSVTDMSFMFSRAVSFDQPLGNWNVSRVTDMSNTFHAASSFNQPLGDWEVSSVRDMSYMFSYATSFDRSFADWDISNETDTRGIFTGADGLIEVEVHVQYDDQPSETGWTLRDSTGILISSQSTGSFTTKGGTLTKSSAVALGTYTFEMTDASGNGLCCNSGYGSFSITANGETVVSNNGQFGDIFQETFEAQIPTPSRFMVFETREELREAVDSYLDNSGKNTLVARTYGWPIGVWDVSKIQDFSYLFSADDFDDPERFNPAAAAFNEDISGWDVSSATTMLYMFAGARCFDQPIGNWNVSSVMDMYYIFSQASSFNQRLGNWNVSSVTNMIRMFSQASSFNQPLADWDVSNVTNMAQMFWYATYFDHPLADWNVSSATNVNSMFYIAESFNQPLADWNVSSVTDISFMFFYAASFNQSIRTWNLPSMANRSRVFEGSGCPSGADGQQSCFLA